MSKSRQSAALLVAALAAALGLFIYVEYRAYVREMDSSLRPKEEKRNVYLITASGLRPDHLSSFSYPSIQTPAMDFLAYDGVRVTNGWSPSPESLPAHLSLLSGIYPFRDPVSPLLERYFAGISTKTHQTGFTMPEWFRRKGYQTSAFLSDPELRIPELMDALFQTAAMGDRLLHSWQQAYTPEQACRLALDWIAKNSARPHLVLLNFNEPSPPYLPPPPFDRHYQSHPYDGEIAALDEQLGLFINRLKSAGLFERSVVVFAAPYATSPEVAGYDSPLKKSRLQVPIFIVAPGILPRQKMYQNAVSLVDVFPTVLSLLRMDPAGLKTDGQAIFERGTEREIRREFLFGGSFWPAIANLQPDYFARSQKWMMIAGAPDSIFSTASESHPADTDASRKIAVEMKARLLEYRPSFLRLGQPGERAAAALAADAMMAARYGRASEAWRLLADADNLPASPFLLALRSELAGATGRLPEALELAQRLLRLAPTRESLAAAVQLRVRALQFAEANNLLARFRKQTLHQSYYDHHMIGVVLTGLGDDAGAVQEFGQALQRNPRFAESLLERSRCYIRQDNAALAEADLRGAAALDPKSVPITRELASLLLRGDQPQDAAPYLRRAMELDPRDYPSMLELARLHASTKTGAEEARRLCSEIITGSRDPLLIGAAKRIIAGN